MLIPSESRGMLCVRDQEGTDTVVEEMVFVEIWRFFLKRRSQSYLTGEQKVRMVLTVDNQANLGGISFCEMDKRKSCRVNVTLKFKKATS